MLEQENNYTMQSSVPLGPGMGTTTLPMPLAITKSFPSNWKEEKLNIQSLFHQFRKKLAHMQQCIFNGIFKHSAWWAGEGETDHNYYVPVFVFIFLYIFCICGHIPALLEIRQMALKMNTVIFSPLSWSASYLYQQTDQTCCGLVVFYRLGKVQFIYL